MGIEAILMWVVLVVLVVLGVLTLRNSKAGADDEPEKAVREELRLGREEASKAGRDLREEVSGTLKNSSETQSQQIERLRIAIDSQLKELREGNEKKLDEMRKTVDEKLQETLEKRLGESFKLVSERLESVQRGLGEMKSLATGVGDLKRVLTNVKLRGTWAEYQLGAILEQLLTPDQYGKNVHTKEGSRELVEYAVRLPGSSDDLDRPVWLPIDSKFPQEDYDRLVEAAQNSDAEAEAKASKALLGAVKKAAEDISTKYLDPPNTTDFAVMFVPTEGLYAEVLRQPGFADGLQQNSRVVVAGPTTLAALLSSLRLGFRTLAIEKRASEVWQVLAAVKSEFEKFGGVLQRVERQLATASNTIKETHVRTRAMERKLSTVEQLPGNAATQFLELPEGALEDPNAEDEPLG